MPRILIAAAAVLAAAVAVPNVAHGATLHQDGKHRVLLRADPGESNLITVAGRKGVTFREDGGAPIRLDKVPSCMRIDPYTVGCSVVRAIELDLEDGPDVAVIDTPHPVSLDAGAGNDRYLALATNGASQVNFAGGIGLDVANYGYATAGVNVSVDLEGGDGRPGDDDQIRRDVETVFGSAFDDVLTGSPRTLQINGFDGDDRITGGSGEETLNGGDGNDRIDARDGALDSIDCGGQAFDWADVDPVEASITRCG